MTVTPFKESRYSYNKFRKGLLFLMFLWFMYGYVVIFRALFYFLQAGIQMSINEEVDITFLFFPLACFVLWIPFYSIFPIMMGIILPDVRVTDTGLFVQVFFFWWVSVPWQEILEIRPRFKRSILRKETTVVRVRRLTPFHRLIGVPIGKSGFQINRSISGYDELIDLIQRKTDQYSQYG